MTDAQAKQLALNMRRLRDHPAIVQTPGSITFITSWNHNIKKGKYCDMDTVALLAFIVARCGDIDFKASNPLPEVVLGLSDVHDSIKKRVDKRLRKLNAIGVLDYSWANDNTFRAVINKPGLCAISYVMHFDLENEDD